MINKSLLTGKKVRLICIDPKTMAPLFTKWAHNSNYLRLLDWDPARIHSAKATQEWIEKHIDDVLSYEFAIQLSENDAIIGTTGLDGVSINHQHAFVGIGIGEEEYWNKGYGTDAMETLLRYAFEELNLYRVTLNVFAYNQRAIRSYQKVGFRTEGNLRQGLLRDGTRWDVIYMGILRHEWLERQ